MQSTILMHSLEKENTTFYFCTLNFLTAKKATLILDADNGLPMKH